MDLGTNEWLDNAQAGAWNGLAKTGVFDAYSGTTPHADIWVSRIVPSVLTGISTNEASIVIYYCNRVIERLLGNDDISTTGLAIGNTNEWPGFQTQMFQNLGYPTSSITTFIRPNDTRQNWMTSLQSGIEYVNVFEHASTNLQQFSGGDFISSNYCTLNPAMNARFYNLFDCSSSRYTTTDNLGTLND